MKFKVVNSGNQIESESKSFSSISVAIRKNFISFESAEDIFIQSSFTRDLVVGFFLGRCQRMVFGPFIGDFAIAVKFLNPCIATIGNDLNPGEDPDLTFFE